MRKGLRRVLEFGGWLVLAVGIVFMLARVFMEDIGIFGRVATGIFFVSLAVVVLAIMWDARRHGDA